MSDEREAEFQELLAFVDFYFQNVLRHQLPPGTPDEVSPKLVVEKVARESGRSKALVGTRQAVNDIIESTLNVKPEGVAALDAALHDAGVVTLTEVRRRYSGLYQRVLKRGRIRNDTEYHLLQGLAVDANPNLPEGEREKVERMVAAYGGIAT